MRSQFIRANAMRIANTLATFEVDAKTLSERSEGHLGTTRTLLAPDIKKWPFIDLDPLLGATPYFLRDDGARATWPIDFGMALPFKGGFRLSYARSVSPKEARISGCTTFSPKMLRGESVDFVDGRFNWGAGMFALLGGAWVDAHGKLRDRSGFSTNTGNSQLFGDVMAGAALRHRYEWSAIFDFPSGISLRFGTTSAGVLEIFRDRERGGGEIRRAALLHWVRRHWRRGTTSVDAAREVRKHLRGKENLSWHGLDVVVVPAEYEVEQAA